jgi:hypothetical protein
LHLTDLAETNHTGPFEFIAERISGNRERATEQAHAASRKLSCKIGRVLSGAAAQKATSAPPAGRPDLAPPAESTLPAVDHISARRGVPLNGSGSENRSTAVECSNGLIGAGGDENAAGGHDGPP